MIETLVTSPFSVEEKFADEFREAVACFTNSYLVEKGGKFVVGATLDEPEVDLSKLHIDTAAVMRYFKGDNTGFNESTRIGLTDLVGIYASTPVAVVATSVGAAADDGPPCVSLLIYTPASNSWERATGTELWSVVFSRVAGWLE